MEKDLLKIIRLLNRHKIKYLLIGGYAAVLYGVPRATFDIDIAIASDPKGEERTISLLSSELGFIEKEKLEGGIRLTKGDIDLDIMFVENHKFNFFYEYHEKLSYKGAIIKLPNMMDLIRIKEASPREKDQEDARYLRFLLSSKKR